jgi:hypothetical protein
MDYPDQSLIDTVTFYGADGTVAYEGRVQALPRDLTGEAAPWGDARGVDGAHHRPEVHGGVRRP